MLDGKVALVTGAAGGIGEAMATVFTTHGASVLVCDVNDSDGMKLAAKLPRAIYQHLDVSNEDLWHAAVAAAMKSFGRLDILINNAGIVAVQSIEDTSRADFVHTLDINLVGVFLGMKIVCEPMKRNGGSIINISSVAALHGPPNMIAYTASKWGVRGISRTAAIEFAPHRIRVNTIFPGMIITSQARNAYNAERLTARTSRIPVGRAGEPNDIANLAAFLCSDAGAYCNGAEFTVDGGETTLNAAGMSGMKG